MGCHFQATVHQPSWQPNQPQQSSFETEAREFTRSWDELFLVGAAGILLTTLGIGALMD